MQEYLTFGQLLLRSLYQTNEIVQIMKKDYSSNKSKWRDQAETLSEALPNLRRFNGETIVIKFGGHAMGDPKLADLFARDIVLLRQVGINPIVVHGGGPQIAAMLERLNIKSTFVSGLRVTDNNSIKIIEMVLAGSINKKIVSAINLAGACAVGICGKDGDLIKAERMSLSKKNTYDKSSDLGLVGAPSKINPNILKAFEKANIIPIIAPIAMGKDGETLNINADTVAGAIASAVRATRLYMLTDVPGVLDKNEELIPDISIADAKKYIKNGIIDGGMIPKITTCVESIMAGVECAAIIDGRVQHSILIELFTAGGAGTLIRAK